MVYFVFCLRVEGGDVLNYNLPYHIIEEEDGEYCAKLSFESIEEAQEFIKFAPDKNLFIVTTEQLEDYLG